MTADRIAHYQQVAGGGEEIQRMFQDIEPAHPFALSLQGLLPQLAAAQAQQAGLSALAADNIVLGHQQIHPGLVTQRHLCTVSLVSSDQHTVQGTPQHTCTFLPRLRPSCVRWHWLM